MQTHSSLSTDQACSQKGCQLFVVFSDAELLSPCCKDMCSYSGFFGDDRVCSQVGMHVMVQVQLWFDCVCAHALHQRRAGAILLCVI